MCGISGVLISPGRSTAQLFRISELFMANLIANEQRGKEATGVALLNRDSSWLLDKAPQTASRYIRSAGYRRVMQSLSAETTVLLGHTREPTKGTPQINANNHPIVRGSIIGVHNGTITNDDEIFAQQTNSADRIGSVDSEAVFALLDSIADAMALPSYGRKLYEQSGKIIGSYAVLYVNPTLPYCVFLLKYKNPVSVHWDNELGALFFSSRYLFLRKTFGRAAITDGLPGRTGFMFDAARLQQNGALPARRFRLFSNES
ncbi:MAG: class II glutamine amidotransferase [Candidatus Electrothrix sp. YB6]